MASRRSRNPNKGLSEDIVREAESLRIWDDLVLLLLKALDLPNINSRHGLKKVHANIDQVFRTLDTTYEQNIEHPRIIGGIVIILARMTADSMLRDRLFKEGKFLPRILHLLDLLETRNLAVDLLTRVAANANKHACGEIATQTLRYLRLSEGYPDDLQFCRLIIMLLDVALAKATKDLPAGDIPSFSTQDIDIIALLQFTISVIHKTDDLGYLLGSLLRLAGSAATCWNEETKSFEPLTLLLVSCLRSNNIIHRCTAILPIGLMEMPDVAEGVYEHNPGLLMQRLQERGDFPPALARVVDDYGRERCETSLTLSGAEKFTNAIDAFFRGGGDLCLFGEELACLTLLGNTVIPGGPLQHYLELLGCKLPHSLYPDLPASDFSDLFAHCAKALRDRGNSGDLITADLLEIQYFGAHARIAEAALAAERALRTNPESAYFYRMMGTKRGAGHSENQRALRALKKGLKAKQTTPFVRHELLYSAIILAGNIGNSTVTRTVDLSEYSESRYRTYAEGIAFLTSALEDAKTFIAEAPPDHGNMFQVLNWYVLLMIVLKGPELSTDLRELQDASEKLDISRKFACFFGNTLERSIISLACGRIVKFYARAASEHTSFISRIDAVQSYSQEVQASISSRAEETLAEWVNDLDLNSDGQTGGSRFDNARHHDLSLPTIPLGFSPELYMCSWCRSPSAVVRKCSGCGKTRYCDAGCQKSHWSAHKVVCKATNISPSDSVIS